MTSSLTRAAKLDPARSAFPRAEFASGPITVLAPSAPRLGCDTARQDGSLRPWRRFSVGTVDCASLRRSVLARRAVCRGLSCLGLDFHGFGESDPYPEMAALADAHAPLGRAADCSKQLEQAVRFICQRHDIPRVSLIAHSWGTIVAGEFAGRPRRRTCRSPGALRPDSLAGATG